jgi:hypothetical protein
MTSKKNLLLGAFGVLMAPVSLGLIVYFAALSAYAGNALPCDAPLDHGPLERFGVTLPPDVAVCGDSGGDAENTSYRLRVSKPNPVCLVTEGAAGCTSMTENVLAFVPRMEGWDTGDIATTEDSATVDFARGQDRVHLRLHRSRYGEVTGDLDLRIASPASRASR